MADPDDLHAGILALLETVDPDTVVFDGEVPAAAECRYLAVYSIDQTSDARPIAGRARIQHDTTAVVCVTDNPLTVQRLADRVADTTDGATVSGVLLRWAGSGPVLEDRDNPGAWRWSRTVEITHTRTR